MDPKELLSQVAENLSVHRAFGTAYEKNGFLVIPVALVAGGGGGGEGTGPEADDDHGRVPSGSGGGFGGLVLPMGAYVVKDETVRFVPAIDVTLIVLASLSLARLLIRSRARNLRRHSHD